MTSPRVIVLMSCLLLAATGLAACGDGEEAVDTSTKGTTVTTSKAATTDGTTGTTSTSPGGPPATVAPDAPGVSLDVSFLRNGKVGTAHRRIASTPTVARAALELLIAGPNATERDAGMTTVIRPETTVSSLSIADGVATVTLSPDFGRGYDDVTSQQATAQVVYTLTQFPSVQKVRFGANGTPVGRNDLRDVTPLILLESVAPGDTVSSPVRVAGESNTFEANVRIQVLGADRRILADTFTTATSGTGTWGTFDASVPFNRGADTTGTVVVFEDSPKDGTMINVVEVPVRFA